MPISVDMSVHKYKDIDTIFDNLVFVHHNKRIENKQSMRDWSVDFQL